MAAPDLETLTGNLGDSNLLVAKAVVKDGSVVGQPPPMCNFQLTSQLLKHEQLPFLSPSLSPSRWSQSSGAAPFILPSWLCLARHSRVVQQDTFAHFDVLPLWMHFNVFSDFFWWPMISKHSFRALELDWVKLTIFKDSNTTSRALCSLKLD